MLIGWSGPVGGIAPLVILSGLLVVVAAGDAIEFSRQHVVIAAWFGLLVIPPVMAVVALVVLPWLNIDLRVTYPAEAMARFFSESFERRTGKPLQIVAGDPRTARWSRSARPAAQRFSQRHARALAVGDGGCDQEQGAIVVLADPRYRRHAAARAEGAFPRWCPKSRACSSARCRDGCRSSASAGRCCGRRAAASAGCREQPKP